MKKLLATLALSNVLGGCYGGPVALGDAQTEATLAEGGAGPVAVSALPATEEGGAGGAGPECLSCASSDYGPVVAFGEDWRIEVEAGKVACLPVERCEACIYYWLPDLEIWHPESENPAGCQMPR
jgi:hypothetical protein